ncbi:alpha/beta fold hydrolase [Kribbella sandramycini]|uniref:3-oxoadipate enol-lactonase n=1 Tax=Kribbella sandramycini TaxID=60450 RepID=A0A7Y4P3Q8_9ACTN|nr:alpha/beta hydrolase [Kribbella sandramycini]MBB6571761.1 3-oxoadipate enol-lactonase [Kribbella sandramycini]NOL44404.1 alpha/beta fold hydrolase [Kribbella sandramycini]
MTIGGVEDRFVETVLGRIRLRVGGSGPGMLFWPSLLMDGTLWAGQVEHFVDRFRVVLVDPPGHGGSSPLTGPFTFEQCAEVVLTILDELGIEQVHLVGNSWGGMIGGTFAALHPDRIGVAVLMNATASPAGRAQKFEYGVLDRATRIVGGIRGPLVGPVVNAFLGPTAKKEKPEVVATVKQLAQQVKVASGRHAVASVVPRRPDQRELFGRIRTPVLVVAGAEDATFPVAETEVMADSIPGARFVVLEQSAHLAALESPAEVNALIDDFIEDNCTS